MGSARSGATQGRPRSHADGPKTGPARLKTAPRGPKKPPEAPRRAWERSRSDFRAILVPPGFRKTSKSAVLSANFVVLAISLGSLQQRPKTLQMEPPGREPQARPGRPQERPKSPQDGSKRRPERAKRRPRPPRTAPGEHPRGPKPPRRLQGALWELILASSWGSRGLIFEPSRRPFRASRAVRSTDESTGRNHWSKGLSRPLRARCAEAIVHSTTELVATGQQVKR